MVTSREKTVTSRGLSFFLTGSYRFFAGSYLFSDGELPFFRGKSPFFRRGVTLFLAGSHLFSDGELPFFSRGDTVRTLLQEIRLIPTALQQDPLSTSTTDKTILIRTQYSKGNIILDQNHEFIFVIMITQASSNDVKTFQPLVHVLLTIWLLIVATLIIEDFTFRSWSYSRHLELQICSIGRHHRICARGSCFDECLCSSQSIS